MKRILIILCIALPVVLLAEMKIGYIDSNAIMSQYSEVPPVQAELEKEQRALEVQFNQLTQKLDSLKANFEKQRLLYSESKRVEKQNEINDLETRVQNYQMEKFGPNGEIYKKQNELLKPILAKIDAAIKVVGAERGYDYILDANSGAIVYALDSHDMTEAVLEELRKASVPGTNE
ncbi:MAG: OmpH family outer membrane protein [FCB group bacterium]|nr:OmpH family outer membrane protein [FCB group bacterium]